MLTALISYHNYLDKTRQVWSGRGTAGLLCGVLASAGRAQLSPQPRSGVGQGTRVGVGLAPGSASPLWGPEPRAALVSRGARECCVHAGSCPEFSGPGGLVVLGRTSPVIRPASWWGGSHNQRVHGPKESCLQGGLRCQGARPVVVAGRHQEAPDQSCPLSSLLRTARLLVLPWFGAQGRGSNLPESWSYPL